MLAETVLNIACACIIYRYILQSERGSTSPSLLTYGLLLPLLLSSAFWLTHQLDIRNYVLKMATASGPVLMSLRCLEALYRTHPPATGQTLQTFVTYYAATVQFESDPATGLAQKVTAKYLLRQVVDFVSFFVQNTLLVSVLMPYDFRVWDTSSTATHFYYYLHWTHIANNLLLAIATALFLEVGSVGVGLATSLVTGQQVVRLNDHPLTRSTSPSDFWGRRWNRIVSPALKRAVFKPLRQNGYSRSLAAVATFVVSGLVHEYLLVLLSFATGQQWLFFLWNGLVLALEHSVGHTKPLQWMAQNLPRPLRTALVLLLVLPVSHWFTDDYVDVGFYNHFAMAFPRLVQMK